MPGTVLRLDVFHHAVGVILFRFEHLRIGTTTAHVGPGRLPADQTATTCHVMWALWVGSNRGDPRRCAISPMGINQRATHCSWRVIAYQHEGGFHVIDDDKDHRARHAERMQRFLHVSSSVGNCVPFLLQLSSLLFGSAFERVQPFRRAPAAAASQRGSTTEACSFPKT